MNLLTMPEVRAGDIINFTNMSFFGASINFHEKLGENGSGVSYHIFPVSSLENKPILVVREMQIMGRCSNIQILFDNKLFFCIFDNYWTKTDDLKCFGKIN